MVAPCLATLPSLRHLPSPHYLFHLHSTWWWNSLCFAGVTHTAVVTLYDYFRKLKVQRAQPLIWASILPSVMLVLEVIHPKRHLFYGVYHRDNHCYAEQFCELSTVKQHRCWAHSGCANISSIPTPSYNWWLKCLSPWCKHSCCIKNTQGVTEVKLETSHCNSFCYHDLVSYD